MTSKDGFNIIGGGTAGVMPGLAWIGFAFVLRRGLIQAYPAKEYKPQWGFYVCLSLSLNLHGNDHNGRK
jgi:hypothetical protein